MVGAAVLATPTYAQSPTQPDLKILIQDKCDPATFNAAVGPGTCVGKGTITFPQFLSQVTQFHAATDWQYSPTTRQMSVGQSFVATNIGGEMHTFTEVDHFAGGFVPLLNTLSGQTSVAQECNSDGVLLPNGLLNPDPRAVASTVPPGGTFRDTEGPNDVGHPVLYQCCIHPWMHETITVRP
jgi:hypothetical protein